MKRIAIFASGSGTNMRNMAAYFENNPTIEVSLVVCNKHGAGVIQYARQYNIPVLLIDREALYASNELVELLKILHIKLIVLAGFMWLIPQNMIAAFPDRIINIHPALLPDFGGKGMYGMKVHEAVIAAGKAFSGITIHYVNEKYDDGAIVLQQKVAVEKSDTPDTLASKIHALEYKHYPEVIDRLLT
jgi:phosphoribosylglycinamide formyltransferase 1